VATDKLDNGCVSAPITVTIELDQELPVVSAEMLRPLTFCDPTKPDGVATANVGGDVVNYVFDWFAGSPAVGPSFYTGAEAGNLAAGAYTVQASHLITGCASTVPVDILQDLIEIPDPTITVLSNITSCVEDNGALSASVDGNTADYILDWSDGATAQVPSDFVGEFYIDRPAGPYTVVATSKINGCSSDPVTETLIVDQEFPELAFLFDVATCGMDDGYMTVQVTNGVDIDTVEWYLGGTLVGYGPNLAEVASGDYEVVVRSQLGCEARGTLSLPAEILPFNGVSRRLQSQNDKFYIDCIEDYPQNRVEIFNRAGTKVFSVEGYDNALIYFDGKSNEGLSLMGNNLPAGTYFYVINKGNGSEKMVGYLEIVD
jgi:hypothetical protein